MLKAFLTISRAKIQLVSFASATLGIAFAAESHHDFLSWDVLAYISLFYVLITFACNINCLFDIEVDKYYKKELSDAVKRIGVRNVKLILVLEIIIALVLISFLLLRGHLFVVLFALFGIFLGFAYSTPPIRSKSKGILSPMAVVSGLYILPISAGFWLVDPTISCLFVLFIISYAVMNGGINLINVCEDYSEDRTLGIRTMAHSLGLKKTLNLATATMVFGGMGAIIGLFLRGSPIILAFHWQAWLAITLLLITVITVALVSLEIYNVGRAENLEQSAKLHGPKLPKWFLVTRYPMLFYLVALLF